MAQPRPAVSPDEAARALLEARDELGAACAALKLVKAVRPVSDAAAHVRAACDLLDNATAGIVAAWVLAAAEREPATGDLLAERYSAA